MLSEAKNKPPVNSVHCVIGPVMIDESVIGESNENDGPKWCLNSRSARNQSSSDEPKSLPLSSQN
jgi:hypothetical protein